MKKTILFYFLLFVLSAQLVFAQAPPELSPEQTETVERLFVQANEQLESKQFAEALKNYQAALKLLPNDESLLYNGGFAAMLNGDNAIAVDLWNKLKKIEPNDWQVRAKLIQAYQRLDDTANRDKEREELMQFWKKGTNQELSEQVVYCRDRFTVAGQEIMVFEVFEFKGPRGRRYIFSILNDSGKENYHISLGSYDTTNAVWRETTKPTPEKDMRLFHLDGYYKNGGHATFGMFPGEPSYEDTKKMVVEIIEKNTKPRSFSISGDAIKK